MKILFLIDGLLKGGKERQLFELIKGLNNKKELSMELVVMNEKIEYKEIRSVKGGILSKIMNLNYLLDYSSIYHAILCKIDPTPVDAIDFVKRRL